jgi:hypothetical protein
MASYAALTDEVLATQRNLVDLAENAAIRATNSLDASAEEQDLLFELSGTVGRIVNTDAVTTSGAGLVWTHSVDTIPDPSDDDGIEELPSVVTVPDKAKRYAQIIGPPGSFVGEFDETPAPLEAVTFSDIPGFEQSAFASTSIPDPDNRFDPLEDRYSFQIGDYIYTRAFDQATLVEKITSALNGNLGLPTGYWVAIWERATDDIAKTRVAALRSARNSGASSYWPLPGEATIKASRRVIDESERAEQMARIEQAVQEAVFAREDFWKAIAEAVKYDQAWFAINDQAARLALDAEKAAHAVRVEIHNSNVADFNALVARASAVIELNKQEFELNLERYRSQLTQIEVELKRDAQIIARHQAEWTAWTSQSDSEYKNIATRLQWWNAQVDSDAKYEALYQQHAKLQAELFTEQLSRIVAVSQSAASLLQARTGAHRLKYEIEDIKLKSDATRNASEIQNAELKQRSQFNKADLDIRQAEWISEQGTELQQAVTQLAVGYAQAIIQASDVSLSSNNSFEFSKSHRASQNAELEWGSEIL